MQNFISFCVPMMCLGPGTSLKKPGTGIGAPTPGVRYVYRTIRKGVPLPPKNVGTDSLQLTLF